jgi:hypothetical protein
LESLASSFTSIKELAEWFGLEIERIVVDECMALAGHDCGQIA